MTFTDYIKIINDTKVFSCSRESLVIDLYVAAGAAKDINATTAAKWLTRKNPGQVRTYFENSEIDGEGFIELFRELPEISWKKLQSAFSISGDHGDIDCETTSKDIFYGSLLKQFLLFFNLSNELINDILSKTGVIRHCLPEKPIIIKRKIEVESIKQIFKTENYAVLTGVGGIGKTSVALAYAHQFNESRKHIIQHIICDDSYTIRDAILQLQFDGLLNCDEELEFDRIIDILKRCKKPTLIIIDNLNREFSPDDWADFYKLVECKRVYFLIISRETLLNNKEHLIHIDPLNYDDIMELYHYYRFEDLSKHKNYIYEHREILNKIFSLVNNHTLMVELIAKLPTRSGLNEYKIYEHLQDGLDISPMTVGIKKDGKCFENTVKDLVKKLFPISKFDDAEKDIIRLMALVSPNGIQLCAFNKLIGYSAKEVNSLRACNWIMMDEEKLRIRLHPLISETIFEMDEIKPSEEMCNTLLKIIPLVRETFNLGSQEWHDINRIGARIAVKVKFSIIKSDSLFSEFNDEFQDALLYLQKTLKEYTESDDLPDPIKGRINLKELEAYRDDNDDEDEINEGED